MLGLGLGVAVAVDGVYPHARNGIESISNGGKKFERKNEFLKKIDPNICSPPPNI